MHSKTAAGLGVLQCLSHVQRWNGSPTGLFEALRPDSIQIVGDPVRSNQSSNVFENMITSEEGFIPVRLMRGMSVSMPPARRSSTRVAVD